MKYKGLDFKKNSKLAYRWGNPKTDFDDNGEPIESNYIVPVRMKDCKFFQKDDKGNKHYIDSSMDSKANLSCVYYDSKDVPMITISGHSRTNMVYGVSKKRTSTYGVYIEGEWVNEYEQTTVYAVLSGGVYTASIKRKIKD